LTASEISEHKELSSYLQLHKTVRKSNRDWLQKFDNQIRISTGKGLMQFAPRRRVLPLQADEKRYFVDLTQPDGSVARRACVQAASGEREYEVPRVVQNNLRIQPTVHIAADQGSTGLPALQFLMYHCGLRATVTYDIFHRCHNNLLDAIASCGLMIIRLEYAAVCKLRRGPYEGAANGSILAAAAAEMEKHWSCDNMLFMMIYDDLVDESRYLGSSPGRALNPTYRSRGSGHAPHSRALAAGTKPRPRDGGHLSRIPARRGAIVGWTSWS